MSKKSIKKAHSTADKIKDKPKAKKSISKWSKGKFDDPESAIYAIATNMQKRKEGKPINPPGRESVSHIGKALIDEPKTLRGKLEEAMRTPNFVLENLKYQGEFEVGMKVKAFDHQPGVPGREDKYIEGEIIAVDAESKSQPGSMGYHVKVEKDTLFTKNSRVGKTVFVPYEISMDYDNRITSARPDDEDEAKALAKSDEATNTFIGGKKGTAEPEHDEEPDNPETEYGEYWHKAKEDVKSLNRLGLTNLIAGLYEKLDQAGEMKEGKMSDIALDMKDLSDAEFQKKHGKSKEEMKKDLSEKAKPDYIDIDGDGNKKEPMKKAAKDKKEKDPQHEALVDKTIKTLETYLDLVSKQGNAKLNKATEDVRKVFGMESKAKPDYIDIDKDGDKKEPMKKAVKDKEKKASGKKMTMDQKIKLLNVGKAIREKAKEEGVQPSQFLGYLVAKNPQKYGALAKLEGIIDGQG